MRPKLLSPISAVFLFTEGCCVHTLGEFTKKLCFTNELLSFCVKRVSGASPGRCAAFLRNVVVDSD